jgi:ComF family protein
MRPSDWVVAPLLELVYPERCALCEAEHRTDLWYPRGHRVPGLRVWDGTHLCLTCAAGLGTGYVRGELGHEHASGIQVTAAVPTNPDLVKLVGQFKYHGLRGLAWPLARLLRVPLAAACEGSGVVDALVPVPLHSRRRRVRGFNQAEILARLLARGGKIPVVTDILARQRNTAQQAKITSPGERRRNLAASFKVRRPAATSPGRFPGPTRIGLVDDLVTSGWTAASAASSLKEKGWDVRWVLALGLALDAKNTSPRVDTLERGF